jgi:hypothetical protein
VHAQRGGGELRREPGARVHGGPHRRGIPLDFMDAVDHQSNGPGLACVGRGGGHAGTERGRRRAAVVRWREPGKGFPAAKMGAGKCYA